MNHTNDGKVKGKSNFAGCVSNANPVQRGHNICNFPGVRNSNSQTQIVEANSTGIPSSCIKRGVR